MKEHYEVFLKKTVENVSAFLAPYPEHIEDIYTWDNKVFEKPEVLELMESQFDLNSSVYKKTIQLKKTLSDKISSSSSFDERYPFGELFVKEWGGVKTNKNLKQLLEDYDKLASPFGIQTLSGVSSWSKYLSLLFDQANIYDSRVAYSVNAINYISGTTDYFFPIPSGRSPKLSLLDIETLFVIKKLSVDGHFLEAEFRKQKQVSSNSRRQYHLPERITYDLYLTLLRDVSAALSNTNTTAVEMLLFAMAPQQVFDSLVEAVRKN